MSKRALEALTESEIRLLLQNRYQKQRQQRLKIYQKTGRAYLLVRAALPAQGLPTTSLDWLEQEPKKHWSIFEWFSRGLRFIEWGIGIGIIVLLLSGSWKLADLNSRTRETWVMPALTATPIIQAIVLPSGHIPPDRSGYTRPRYEEAPAHLRQLMQSQVSIPTPTAAPQHGVRIQIPAINVDAPIVQGDGWDQLKKGVAQHIGTANPGERGNMVLSGHNDVYGEVFRYLDRLKAGDEITVFTFSRSYTYVVEGWVLVEPTQVEVMAQTNDEALTLISCYPYLIDTQRIIVKARLLKGR
jgi:sortase A